MGSCRVACAAVLTSALLFPNPTSAENRLASTISLYSDDDGTDVITSLTRASADPWKGGTVEAGYLIDMITSASIDLISNATPIYEENRQALTAGVRHDFGGAVASLNYGYSHEPDYDGHGIGGGLDLELAQKNATLGVSYALELSDIGRRDDPNYLRELTTHAIDLKGSQILTPWLVASFGYTLQLQDGFTASPYRNARVFIPVTGAERGVAERHPDARTRHAIFGGLKAHLFDETAVEARYRLYADSWSVVGHTTEVVGHLGWSENWGARLRYRFYWQGQASFWQFQYDREYEFMTRDRELSPLSSHLTGLKLFGRVEDVLGLASIQLTAKFDGFYYVYRDFPILPNRLGFVSEAGLEVVF